MQKMVFEMRISDWSSDVCSAEVTAAEERAQQTLIAYRQTLLRALEEVEAALLGHAGAGARATALREAVAANQIAAARARSLYTQRLVGFIDVPDAQREDRQSVA